MLIFIGLSKKSRKVSPYIIAMIPLAYTVGIIGLKSGAVNAKAEFNGKYCMLVYDNLYFNICKIYL